MPRRIPSVVKIGYTLWFLAWVPAYWVHNGPLNFLWLCDVSNWLLLAGLWMESSLLLSAQAVGVLAIQSTWIVDFFARLLVGRHLIGGTQYMFDSTTPLWLRSCSLFHLWVPLLLLWAIARLGYDRRAPWLQTAVAWIVLPVSCWLGDTSTNLNWLWRPFEMAASPAPPALLLLVAMIVVPLVLYLPAHLALSSWQRRRSADLAA